MTISLPPASLFQIFMTGNYTLIWSGLNAMMEKNINATMEACTSSYNVRLIGSFCEVEYSINH